jgi:hypothetical protein
MKKHTGYEWLEFFDIEMIDPDGWRKNDNVTLDDLIDIEEFVDRINISTIRPPRLMSGRYLMSGKYIFNFLV